MTLPQLIILTTMEYVSLMLIVSGVAGKLFIYYMKPLLLFAPVYVSLAVSSAYVDWLNWFVAFTVAYSGIVMFIKIVYNRKLGMAIYISAVSSFISIAFIQSLAVVLLGIHLSGPVEFTFNNGITVMTLKLFFTGLFYLILPLHKIAQISKENYKYLTTVVFVLLIMVYLLSTSAYSELLDFRLAFTFLPIGISFILTAICYSVIKYVLALFEKKSAQKRFIEFENLPAIQSIQADEYKKHLEIIHTMSLAGNIDNDRAMWYIKTHLNSFEDEEVGYESKSRLKKLDNYALAAYLYVKIRYLRKQGYKCSVTIFQYSAKTEIKTSKIIEALDIMIDEALQTADIENCDLNIIFSKNDDGRPCIDVANRNELVTLEVIKQMALLEYSLKSKKIRGLRKLNKIGVEYNCGLSLQEEKTIYGKYLKFGLEI